MFRITSVAVGYAVVDAYRLNLDELLAADDTEDLSAHLFAQENATINKDCFQERFWPPQLAAKFPNGKMVGSGATACVAIADYKSGIAAIKIGKKGSSIKEWKIECKKLQKIRMDGCRHKVLDLHEQYIPTCIEVGTVEFNGETINWYAMHAASVEGISQLGRKVWDPNLADRKKIGAQIVGSIYAFHESGYAHNDMHGNNVVLSPKTKALQLIDLGDGAGYPGWIKDYKRDSNAVWRWLAVTADCPEDAQWFGHLKGKKVLQEQAARFANCIETKWNPGADFMEGLDVMLKGCVANSRKHNVELLYNTKFTKTHLPPKKNLYPSDITKGCESFTTEQWLTRELQSEFADHYKCDHIGTYKAIGAKGKETIQCLRGRPHKSGGQGHCFSTKPGVPWGCAGAIDWDGFKAGNKPCNEMGAAGGGLYAGGCLTPEHPGYRVTKNGSPR